MYILLNEKGDVITSIPHTDRPVRQGNDFDLHICFPREDRFLNLTPFVEFSIDGKFVIAGLPDYSQWGLPAFTFQKTEPNEAIFEFKPGISYYCYHISVPREAGVTAVSGAVPMVISVVINDVTRQGRAVLNVLKTYGSDDIVGVDSTNLDALMKLIKQATNIFQFDSEARNGFVLNDVILYSWKTLGFVHGEVWIDENGEELSNMPEYEGQDGYVEVASFPYCVDIVVPTTFIGHTDAGDDVEFKIIGDGTEFDGNGSAHLLINKLSDVSKGEKLSFVGQFIATQNTFQFSDGETTTGEIVVAGVAASAEFSTSPNPEVEVSLPYAGDEGSPERILTFDFGIPRGEKGEDGRTPVIAVPTSSVSRVETEMAGQPRVDVSLTSDGNGFSEPMKMNFDFRFGLPPALVSTGLGAIGFSIDENAHLIAHMATTQNDGLSIVEDRESPLYGHLVLTYEEE